MIKKNAILLSLAVILLPLLAQAQGLVIFDARDLFPKDAWNPPCKAVFTQEYYDSDEWMGLKDRIDKYLLICYIGRHRRIRTGSPWPMKNSGKR